METTALCALLISFIKTVLAYVGRNCLQSHTRKTTTKKRAQITQHCAWYIPGQVGVTPCFSDNLFSLGKECRFCSDAIVRSSPWRKRRNFEASLFYRDYSSNLRFCNMSSFCRSAYKIPVLYVQVLLGSLCYSEWVWKSPSLSNFEWGARHWFCNGRLLDLVPSRDLHF